MTMRGRGVQESLVKTTNDPSSITNSGAATSVQGRFAAAASAAVSASARRMGAVARATAALATMRQVSEDAARERVMYPRRQRPQPLRRSPLVGGTPITEDVAMALRRIVFGHSNAPTRSEWLRTAIVFREPDADLSYGLRLPRNGTRSLLAVLQAHVIKHLLFPPPPPRPHPRAPGAALKALRPNAEKQQDALWQSLSDIIWRAGDRVRGIVCLAPCVAVGGGEETPSYVPQSSAYFQDGVTEKLRIFQFTIREDLEIFMKCYSYIFQEDPGPGTLLLLYSAVLSRGIENVRSDLGEDRVSLLTAASVNAASPALPPPNQIGQTAKAPSGALPPSAVMPTSDSTTEEGPECIVTLTLTGRSTPHLHNGVIYVGDENTYARPRYGIPCRSEVGFLVWRGDADDAAAAAMSSSSSMSMAPPEDGRHPGSRLKTPSLPIWVTFCGGHYGVMFNTNRELLRDYHAERRFDLYYYSGGHTGNHTLLSVDTRFAGGGGGGGGGGISGFGMLLDDPFQNGNANKTLNDYNGSPPLEHLIHTKWKDAQVTWNGTVPHV